MTAGSSASRREGEPRLPMAMAVLAVAVFALLVPPDFRINEVLHWAFPVAMLVLLGLLVLGDPGRIDRDTPWLRVVGGSLIGLIAVVTAFATVRLVVGILDDARFSDPRDLLITGGLIWLTNVVAFALGYWHLDAGGPAVRLRSRPVQAQSFRFAEDEIPERLAEGWYPQFIDYFAYSFSTATAFGPTDVAAVRHWAKLAVILESSISLVLIGLVLARAVNIL